MTESQADTVFGRLMQVLADRKQNPSEKSYTSSLFAGGTSKIGSKIREEAEEVAQAADESGDEGRKHFVHEAADVIYHLFALLAYKDVPLAEVEQELARRFGISGLEEKASRPKP